FIFAGNVSIPNQMLSKEIKANGNSFLHDQKQLIISNYLDFTEIQLHKLHGKNLKVFCINEDISFADLVENITVDYDNENKHQFDFQSGCVRDALLTNTNVVVLKGNPGKELSYKLQTLFSHQPYLFVNGIKETYNAQLIILSSENKYFTTIKPTIEVYQQHDFYTD